MITIEYWQLAGIILFTINVTLAIVTEALKVIVKKAGKIRFKRY